MLALLAACVVLARRAVRQRDFAWASDCVVTALGVPAVLALGSVEFSLRAAAATLLTFAWVGALSAKLRPAATPGGQPRASGRLRRPLTDPPPPRRPGRSLRVDPRAPSGPVAASADRPSGECPTEPAEHDLEQAPQPAAPAAATTGAPQVPAYWRVRDGPPAQGFSQQDGAALCRADGTVADPVELPAQEPAR
jgi:hypothetical protein